MPKSLPIFSSFSSGEISPLLAARADVDAYKNGCAILKNMISTSHGPARRRFGTEMVAWDVPLGEGPRAIDGRIFGFSISKSFGTFVFVTFDDFGNSYIAPHAPDGMILPPAIELVTNPRFEDGATGWADASQLTGAAVFQDGHCELIAGSHPTQDHSAKIRQEVTGTVNGNNLTLHVDCENADGLITIKVGTAVALSDIYTITTLSKVIDVEFENTGATSVFLEIKVETNDPSRIVETVSMFDSTLTQPIDAPVKFLGPWNADDMPFLQADSPPEGDVLYITSPFTPVQKLTYDRATNAWSFAAVTFTAPPSEWATDNYPRAITFFQGRMWLGGTPNERETFWASKSADIENFTQGSLADDGLEFTLSEQGAVEWITGAKNLIIGTANGEHIVESSGGVITPSDIQIIQQSSYGSGTIQAEKIGQKVMYVSPDGRKVREIGYQWTDDGWLSRDITFASEHITDGNNIKQTAFAQNPNNLLWCVTDQGGIVCGTYEKTYNVIGWHQHDTIGSYLDVASVDINGSSIAGFLVKRLVWNPQENTEQERLFFEVLDPAESAFQDCWKYFYSDTAVVEIDGMEHLAGQLVDVLTDSGVHPSVPVSSDGKVYLQWEAKEVICGHNFISHMRTLSPDMIGTEGSTHALQKGWNRIVVRILNSAKPIVNGNRPAERHPETPMDEPEPMRIEDVSVSDLGYESWSRIDIQQDLPLPLTVIGIFGEQQRNSL